MSENILLDILNEAAVFSSNVDVNKFYRTKANLPIAGSNRVKGCLLYLMTPNLATSIKHINDTGILENKGYSGYYFDRIVNFKVMSKLIRQRFKERDRYNEIKTSCPKIRKFNIALSKYMGFNTFYDLSDYNTLYFENLVADRNRNISGYFNLLNDIMTIGDNSKLHTDKYILFPISEWLDNIRDPANYRYRNNNNPFTYIFKMIESDIEVVKKLPKIVFYSTIGWFIFDINKMLETDNTSEKIQAVLKKLMFKLHDREDSGEIEAELVMGDVVETVDDKVENMTVQISKLISPTGSDLNKSIDNAVVRNAVQRAISATGKTITADSIDTIMDELNDDVELVKDIIKIKASTLEPSHGRLAREDALRKKFQDSTIKGKKVKDLLEKSKKQIVAPVRIEADVINKELNENVLQNFDDTYTKNMRTADTIGVLDFFTKNKTAQLAIVDYSIEDASDAFNLQERVTCTFEDRKGKRHTIKVLLPYLQDGMFMYLYGSEKNLIKQMAFKPVVKTKPDTVQISSNYKKIFMYREGTNLSSKVIRFKEAIKAMNGIEGIEYDLGNYTTANAKFVATIEFDSLAEDLAYIKFFGSTIYFNLNDIDAHVMANPDIKFPINECTAIGVYKDGRLLCLHRENNKVYLNMTNTGLELIDFIIAEIVKGYPDMISILQSIKVPSKYMYTRCKLMGKYCPTVILLAFSEGLTTVLKKAGVKYKIVPIEDYTRPDITERDNFGVIEFADAYLVFDRYPYENSILLNGLSLINTSEFNISDIDDRNTYLRMFESMYGDSKVAQYFDNFYELMLDSITLDVLEDLDLPTDYVSLMLYASALLVDNRFMKENNLMQSRVRGQELINAYFYNELAEAYQNYRLTAANNNPKPFSIREDAVVTRLLTEPIVEEYSSLNPILEAEKARTVGYKGLSGINHDRAYTIDKRIYDPSMLGNIALSSPPSGKVGVTRQLCTDANILTGRGYLGMSDDASAIHGKNLMTPGEALVPFANNHDDAPRIAMASTQQKHVTAIDDADPFIVTNGVDKIMHGLVSDRFCFKAKQAGVVTEIDKENNIMIVQYADGENDVVNIGPEQAKNSGGGFFIVNQLSPALKVGDKFIKDEAIAFNDKYFTKDMFGNITFMSSAMVNVALLTSYYTYEDSTAITERLANRMATDVVMNKNVVLNPNTNISSIVKIGDKVKVGQPLIVFEENMTDDPDITKMLAKVGDDIQEEINDIGRSIVKSSYAGYIHDIKIYYTCELDEMTPTMRKIVDQYRGKLRKAKKKIETARPGNPRNKIMLPPDEKIVAMKGKVKGEFIDNGILIEFYIRYKDIMAIGDKLTYYTALKGIVGEIIPYGKEPYLLDDPEEKVDAFLSHISVDARMTTSPIIAGVINKVFIELKKKMKDIYYS